MSSVILPFPQDLRPVLPTIVGNVDYQNFRNRPAKIDSLLRSSGLEKHFIELATQKWTADSASSPLTPTAIQILKFQQSSRIALRCQILRTFLQLSYRDFSRSLADSPLGQWFCQIDTFVAVKVPSKSALQRFSDWLPEGALRQIHGLLLKAAIFSHKTLGLADPLDTAEYFVDSTCLKTNIHFPVDWVLLRDAVRTLMKATLVIRNAGICHRMEPPEEFLRRINRLCIEMTQGGGNGEDSQRHRKRTLRRMKLQAGIVRKHARRHRDLLDAQWEKTEWTRKEADVVIARIDHILGLLPKAIRQAHERIIAGRPVDNADKVLSLYETDTRVIVRGKAGAQVEFGNTVLLGENRQGVILDYEIFRESAPADSQLLMPSVTRVWETIGVKVGAVVSDRGFASKANSAAVTEGGTVDATCPRNPREMSRKMKDQTHARRQRRRSQTEGRIAIVKNCYLGSPMRSKGFENRQVGLAWGVLVHNLWKVAGMVKTAAPRKRRKRQVEADELKQAA